MAGETAETNRQLVARFWQAMNTNDWRAAGALLHDEYVLEWPQSQERIRGREHFTAVNAQYPIPGPWRFKVHRIIADEREAPSDVTVAAPTGAARAGSFFAMRDGLILRVTQLLAPPFPAPGR